MRLEYLKLKANKAPMTKLDVTHESLSELENSGLLLNENVVLVDFDNDNSNELKIIKYLEATYNTLMIKTNRGCHFYYSKPKDLTVKNWTDCITVGGFQVDYKTGAKSYGVVKLNGILRETNQPLTLDNLPELPAILYPLKSKNNITGLSEGEGRNNNLFKHLMLVKEQHNEINIKDIAFIINTLAFNEPMGRKELESIINSVISRESTDTYYGDKKDIAEFAKFIVKKLDIKLYGNSIYFKYSLAYSSNEYYLQREVNKFLKLSRQQFGELKHQLINYAEMIDEDSIFKVKIRNGYIEDDKVVNCDDEFTPFYLDVTYDSNAFDKEVDDFINFICLDREDLRIVIEELIGHILMTTEFPAHIFFLTGNGANGKSTFVKMLTNFTGTLSSHVDLSNFKDDTSVLGMRDKLVNIADDIDSNYIDRVKHLKTLASGDVVGGRPNYKDHQSMTGTITLIFTANEIPIFKDKTGGMRRRVMIIPFDNKVRDIKPKLLNLLSTDKAKSYLLILGLKGIGRIIKNGMKISNSPTINKTTNEYNLISNNVEYYLSKNPNINNKITTDIYESYKDFCSDLALYPVTIETFSKKITKLGYSISNTTRKNKKVKVYKKDTLDTLTFKNL